jgi:16S rRNA (guanine(966)-N(2))-methyltransferase RsmD
LRETLFNILAPRILGARFLDLCAGSGAIGIEALSRGAAHVTFVDCSREMCALIEANLTTLEISKDKAEVSCTEVAAFLSQSRGTEIFDLIFFDPPYAADYEAVLNYAGINARQLLTKHGVAVVEHHKKKELGERFGVLRRYRSLKQGDSCLSFYEISQPDA